MTLSTDQLPKPMADALALAQGHAMHVTVYGRNLAEHAALAGQIVLDHTDDIQLATAGILAAIPVKLRGGISVQAAFGDQVHLWYGRARHTLTTWFSETAPGPQIVIPAVVGLIWLDHTQDWLNGLDTEVRDMWWNTSTELTGKYGPLRQWVRRYQDDLPLSLAALLITRLDAMLSSDDALARINRLSTLETQ